MTGNVQIPGANDFRTKNVFETSCVGGGDSGIVDYGGCVDNVLHSAELRVDIAQGNFQGRQVANINLSIRTLVSCARRKAGKFLDDLASELIRERKGQSRY